jgi:hypothetical protein
VTPTPAEIFESLSTSLSAVAGALFAVDSSPDLLFVQSQATAGNVAATQLVADLAAAWEQFTLAKDAVDQLGVAITARTKRHIDELLGAAAVTVPDGTKTDLTSLVAGVGARVDELARDVAHMAEWARVALRRLDAFHTGAQVVLTRSQDLGSDRDPEITMLRATLDRAAAAIATDPADGTALGDLEGILATAQQRVDLLDNHRRQLPAELAAAAAELSALEVAVREGADAFTHAHDRIAAPTGLLQPLDLETGGDRALRPWLERVQHEADAGSYETAFRGVTAWRKAAAEWLTNARRVAATNAAPVVRRNELRGLIDAYRAKAAALGRAEDGHLARIHAAAKAVLYAAPCSLDSAERLVRDYVSAVNAAIEGSTR